ncbi:MAG TPA: helix-turn-helix transcriptional regulator [Desulfotomaculum sp.]|nr:helix-turn-helix transcriptional regulator [Desulfotomaculum sp.]
MKWPERLRQVRLQRSLKQRELAEMVHVSSQTIYDIETGRRRAHAELVAQLAQALHVSADYLLGLSNDPNPHGLEDEPAGLKKVFWGLKADYLLTALVARCLDLPRDARLSVLEHWEMDLFIEEKKVSGGSGNKPGEFLFPAAVHEAANVFGTNDKSTLQGAAAPEKGQREDTGAGVFHPGTGRAEAQGGGGSQESPETEGQDSRENRDGKAGVNHQEQ